MQDAIHHQRFTRSLEDFSARLDELLQEMRRFEPSLIPVELLDECASTLGELMLVLIEHKNSDRVNDYAGRAASDAQRLREGMRLGELHSSQIAEAINALLAELGTIIHEDKRAA